MKQLDQVRAFHDAFGIKTPDTPRIPEKDRAELRVKLIAEELKELQQAIETGDIVEAADALSDLQYVVLGSVLEFGLASRFEALFDEVQRSNMSKLDDHGKPIYREDGKVLKSDRWSPPALKEILHAEPA